MRSGTPRLQAVVCSRDPFAVFLRHRPAITTTNGRKRVGMQGILRRYDGRLRAQARSTVSRLTIFISSMHALLLVKRSRIVRILCGRRSCVLQSRYNACVPFLMVGAHPISLTPTRSPSSSVHWQYAFYCERAPPGRMAVPGHRPQEDLPDAEVGHLEVRDGNTIADSP